MIVTRRNSSEIMNSHGGNHGFFSHDWTLSNKAINQDPVINLGFLQGLKSLFKKTISAVTGLYTYKSLSIIVSRLKMLVITCALKNLGVPGSIPVYS